MATAQSDDQSVPESPIPDALPASFMPRWGRREKMGLLSIFFVVVLAVVVWAPVIAPSASDLRTPLAFRLVLARQPEPAAAKTTPSTLPSGDSSGPPEFPDWTRARIS